MTISITVHATKAKEFFQKAPNAANVALRDLLRQYGMTMKRATIQNIERGGATFGNPFKPASKWIKAKKGASYKVLGDTEKAVHYRVLGRKLTVYSDPEGYTLSQHDAGFTVPPTNSLVILHLVNPGALGLTRDTFGFWSRRPSIVPAREVWANESVALRYLNPMIDSWLKAWVNLIPGLSR